MVCFKSLLLGSSLAFLTMTMMGQQTSQSQSSNQTGNSKATASSSSAASAGGTRNAAAGQQGFGFGSGSALAAPRPTHAYTLTPNRSTSPEVEQSHRDYLLRLGLANKVLYAGPWRDLPGELVIVAAKDDEEAKQLVANDPAVASTAFAAELRAWKPYLAPGRQSSSVNTVKASRGN